MTGIDGISPSFNRVQAALQRDVGAGTVSATDQTAITSALGDIAAQLSAGTPASATTSATGTPSTPTSMKDRVDAMIDNEVSTGKLTTDQASELKAAFQQVHVHMHGAHGHHGGGAAGILASLTGQSSTSDDPTGDGSSTSAGAAGTTLAASATTAVSALENFISQFKSALGSNALYGASGANGSTAMSLLVNAIG